MASRVRLRPDGTREVEYLCELDLAEERMSSGFGRRSLFDEFFSDFFGDTPGGGGRVAAPARQAERIDVTQFFSDATRELLQRAARTAVDWGSLDLDSDHLLHAALADDVVRHVLGQLDADPDAIAAQVEEEADKGAPTDVSPSLSPDAKTIEILHGLKDRYEAFHRVRISDEAIVAAAELSDRYVRDRLLPDKAIDLVDQASARVRLRSRTKDDGTRELDDDVHRLERERDQATSAEDYDRAGELRDQIESRRGELDERRKGRQRAPEVTAEDIAEVVSRATGIPVSQLTTEERQRLMRLEEELHGRIVGQDEAVSAVAEAVRRSRAGLGDPNRPVGSFLFLGPTGVGKTELARALAEALFGDQDLMIRFDMSEFQERHTVSRLVGAPPGYVGYEEAGQLTEAVRRRPYAVLLFDEIEKAHGDVFNILLQILDDGRLTDAQGRTVDFKHTVVIMTSNLGADRIQQFARQGGDFERLKDDLMDVLRRSFRPEFINRIDEIIVFRALTDQQLLEITRMLLDRLARRVNAQRIGVEFTDDAVHLLAQEGCDPEFGARPLRRTIQRLVENELSRLVLSGEVEPGDRVVVDAERGGLHFEVESGTASELRQAEEAAEREPAGTSARGA